MSNRADRRREASLSRRRTKQHDRPTKDSNGPFYFKDPFADIPQEQFRAAALTASEAATARLPDTLAKAVLAAANCDPIYFLGAMTRAVLTASVRADGRIESNRHEGWEKAIKHFHVEWAQALFLNSSTPAAATPSDFVQRISPQAITALTDALHDLGNDYQMSRLSNIDRVPEDLRPFAMLQEKIRLHTVIVRNWGYYDEEIYTIKSLFSTLSDDLISSVGFNAALMCDLFDFLVRRTERLLNENFMRLRNVATAKTPEQLIEKYAAEFSAPDKQSNPADLNLPSGWSRENALAMVLSHNDLVLGEDLCFDAGEVERALNISSPAASQLLSAFSITPQPAPTVEANAIFLANPVWKRPIMALAEDRFICPMPQLFFDSAFSILGEFLKKDPKSAGRLERRRAQYLEDIIVQIFKGAFPDGQYVSGAKWRLGGRTYETDLLYQVDSQLFIVEAKAGAVTGPALRGAPDRIRRHIEELIVAPALQSFRLEQALQTRPEDFTAPLGIDFSTVTEITRLAITLEDFATVQTDFFELTEAGVIPPEATSSVTMSISDLDCVFHVLENSIEIMYYINRRKEIQQRMKYKGDELDLLGMYINNGLNFGEIEKGEIVLQMLEMSADVDQYFQAQADGIVWKKPAREFSPWFIAIRDQLAQSRPARWTEAATALMRISLDDQKDFTREFERVRNKIRRTRAHKDERDSVLLTPPVWSEWGFAAISLRDPFSSDRHNKIESVAQNLFSEDHVKRCVVLCRPTNHDAPAYTTLVLLDRPSSGGGITFPYPPS